LTEGKDTCPRCGKAEVTVKVQGRTSPIGQMPNQGAEQFDRCGLCGWYSIRKSCGHRYQLIELSTVKGVEKYPMKCPSPECDPNQGKGLSEAPCKHEHAIRDMQKSNRFGNQDVFCARCNKTLKIYIKELVVEQ